jgi:hypothetical protein
LLPLIRNVYRDDKLRSELLSRVPLTLRAIYDSRYAVGILVALGFFRVVISLLAYPPTQGADATDYYLYAAQFEGLDAPIVFELIYPLYPLLIYITHYALGSTYILIILQAGLSAVQGAIFYLGIRPYNPLLAFIIALMVLGDAQTGILYNFVSTEPIYMFLLNLAFCVFVFQVKRPSDQRIQRGDIALGILLALTLLARPVGRYLIVPFVFLFLLGTRSLWRSAVVAISYGIMLVASMLFNQIIFDQFELKGGGRFMLNRPLIESGLLDADNGTASKRILDLRDLCLNAESRNRCLVDEMGSWQAIQQLYADAYQEMLQTRGKEFAELVIDYFNEFLRQPGIQYHHELGIPSEAQCANIDAKVQRETETYLEKDWMLYGASDMSYERLSPIIRDIATAMCPPWPDNAQVRELVDRVALRYRSISRPHPYLWYGAIGLLVLVIPWARRYLFPVLLAGAILANHAAISAMVLNVQPRYIAVTNACKGFLVLTLLFILGTFALRIIDELLAQYDSRKQ